MSVECFVDAGILVYAVSSSPGEAVRKRTSVDLLKRTDFGLSAGVLEEFFVTVTSRIRRPLSVETAMALLDEYRFFPLALTDYPLIASAVELSVLHAISYRNASVLAAARALGAPVVYSDAFGAGATFGGIRVINPFV